MDTRSVLDGRGLFLGSNSPFQPPAHVAAAPPTQGTGSGGLHHLGSMCQIPNVGSSHRSRRSPPVAPTMTSVSGQTSSLPAHFQGAGKCFPPPPQSLPGASSGGSYPSCLSNFLQPSRSPDVFKHHQGEVGLSSHSMPLASHYWPHTSEGLHPFPPPFYHPYLPLTPLHPSAPDALTSLAHVVTPRIADTTLPSLIRPPSHGDLLPFYHHGDSLNTANVERYKEITKGQTSKTEHKSRKTNEGNKKRSDKADHDKPRKDDLRDNAVKGQSKQKLTSNNEKTNIPSEPSQPTEMQLKEEHKSSVAQVPKEIKNQSSENISKAKDFCEKISTPEQIQNKSQGKLETFHNELIKDVETTEGKGGQEPIDHKKISAKECILKKDKNVSEKLALTNTISRVVENLNVEATSKTIHPGHSEHKDVVLTDSVELPKNEQSQIKTSSFSPTQPTPSQQVVTEPVKLTVAPVLPTSKCSSTTMCPLSTPPKTLLNVGTKSELEALELVSKNPVKLGSTKTSPAQLMSGSPPVNPSSTSNSPSNVCHTSSSRYTVSSGQNKFSTVNQPTSSSLTSLPLYVNGTGCMTVQRESHHGVVRDGTKVHATTFVPAMGDYIPTFGSGSAHREGKPKSSSVVPGVDHTKVTIKKEKGNSFKMSSTSIETKDICNLADERGKGDSFSLKNDSNSHVLTKQLEIDPKMSYQSTDSIKVEQFRSQDNVMNVGRDGVISVQKQTEKFNKIEVPKTMEEAKHSPKDQHIKTSKTITSRTHHRSGEDNSNKHAKNITENYPSRKQDFAGVKTGPKALESTQQGRSTPSGKAPPPVGIAVAQKRHGRDAGMGPSRSRGKYSLQSGSRPASGDANCEGTRGKFDIADGSRPPSNNRLGSNLIVTGGEDYRRSSLLKSESSTPAITHDPHWYTRMAATRPTYLPGGAYGLSSTHPATYNPAVGDSAQGQLPLPPPGWQLAKDPATGQLLWIPTIDAGGFPYFVPPHLQHPSHQLLMSQHMYGINTPERQEQASQEYQAAVQQQQQAYAEYARQFHERQEQHKRELSRPRSALDYVQNQEKAAEVTHCHPYLPGIGHLGLPAVYPGHGGIQYVFDPATRAFIPVQSPSISIDEKHRPKPPSSRGSSASELHSPKSTSHSAKSEPKDKQCRENATVVKSISVQTFTEHVAKDLKTDELNKEKLDGHCESSDNEIIDVGGTQTIQPLSPLKINTSPPESTPVTTGTPIQSGEALDLSMKTDSQGDPLAFSIQKSTENLCESVPEHERISNVSVQESNINDIDRSEDVTCAMQALLNLTASVPVVETAKPAQLDAPDVVDISQLASLNGIALLSAVAQQKPFCEYSFSESSELKDVKEEEPIEKLTGNTVSSADSQSASELLYKQRLAKMKKDEEKTLGSDDVKMGSDMMNPNELEMRMKMAEIQRKYKERKRELDRLQRRKLKKIQKVDSKKSPGRPRKRRSSSKHAAKTVAIPNYRASRPDSTGILLSAAEKVDSLPQLHFHAEKIVPSKTLTENKKKNTTKKLQEKLLMTAVMKKNNKSSVKAKSKEGQTLTNATNVDKPKKKKKKKMQPGDSPKKAKPPTSKTLCKKTNPSNLLSPSNEEPKPLPMPGEDAGKQLVLDAAIKRVIQKSSSKHVGPKAKISVPVKKPEVRYSQVYGDSDSDDSQEESLPLGQLSFFPRTKKTLRMEKVSTEKGKSPKKKKRSHSDDSKGTDPVKKKKKRKDGSRSSDKNESKKKNKKGSCQKSPKHTTPEDKKEPIFDEQIWSRRRSERIFLNDTSPIASRDVSPSNKKQSQLNQTGSEVDSTITNISKQEIKLEIELPGDKIVSVLDALTTDPLTMRKKLERLSGSGEENTNIKTKLNTKKIPTKVKDIYSDNDDSDKDVDDSESEDLPLSVLRERPASPAQRSCAILPEELCHGLRVLIPIDNLFYAGYVSPIQPPDVYGVIIDGQRGNRPHVFSQEQMLQQAILDVKPKSVRYLPEGSRICAYWSQQYRCLYPGTVVKGSPNPTVDTNYVSVEFDDGDSGRILIDDIRLLPPDYPVLEIEPSTVLLERRRRRKTSNMSTNGASSTRPQQQSSRNERSDCDMRHLSECEGDDDVFIKEKSPIKAEKKKIKSDEKTFKKKKNKELKKMKKEELKEKLKFFSKKSDRRESDGSKSPGDGSKSKSKKKNKKFKLKKQISKENRKEESRKRNKTKKKQKCEPHDITDGAQSLFVTPFVDSSDTVDSVTDGENLDMQIFPEVIASDSDDNFSDSSTEDPEMKLMLAQSKRRHYSVQTSSKKNDGYQRQLWQWSGKSTQRRGIKGKAKKLFYKAISRGEEIVRVGECAVFLSTGRAHLPYIGRIESIWESWGGNMVVRVKWFYHPEETKGGRRPHDGKVGSHDEMALYLSPHVDENDVQTISHKCEVLSVDEYNQRTKKISGKCKEDMYYLAGTYDPTNGHLVPVSQMENFK